MTDVLEAARAIVEQHYADGHFKGRKNAYECDGTRESFGNRAGGCGAFIVTIDVHPGVTPFMLKCGRCGGYAHSKMYRVADWLEPTHEWYRPETLEGVDRAYYDHLSKGGLILRPIGADEWQHPSGLAAYRLAALEGKAARVAEEVERAGRVRILEKEPEEGQTLSRQQRRYRDRKGPSLH